MAKKLTLKLDLISLVKSAAGSDRDKAQAYIEALRDSDVKREFGKRCIDSIIDRTLSGVDKNGKGFKKYSQAYKKSDVFKIYGKTNTVNLKLTGEMQAAIDVINVSPRTVTIGFISDTENDKAHGHVNGSNYLPVRDFWGISEKEQIAILKDTLKDFSEPFDFSQSEQSDTSEPIEFIVGRQSRTFNTFESNDDG